MSEFRFKISRYSPAINAAAVVVIVPFVHRKIKNRVSNSSNPTMAANEGEGSGFNLEFDAAGEKFVQKALLLINACAETYEAGLDVLMITGMHEVKKQKAMFDSMEIYKATLNHQVLLLRNWIETMQDLEEILGEDASMEEKREIKATAARLTESFNRKFKEYRDAVEDERKKREAQMQWIDSSVDSMIFLLSMAAQKASAKKEE